MGLFKSKEEREAQEQREHKIKQLELELRTNRRAYRRDVEAHQQANAKKWEYLQVSDKNIKKWGNLNRLGQAGWELVSASTYAEGVGNLTIYTQYVFKRRVYDLPTEMIGRSIEIIELETKINELEQQR